ncbi:RHS repeat-associated core domain-containing protein [Pseudomonas sp. LRP2-20]|uniref:RHS repeat-associated core domain-containing protein n=1 Tax=Pseudomonas sp. LRP2-20 TaxID=2944234 RepID=UPI0021863083|nr:RHS repeat-associated core domain-containing protein [Pseudomonas sp. LRP2-20]BDM22165.1 RHS repeat-associated core domain-containing protein [Pseudomonas sp. LRP2-20]
MSTLEHASVHRATPEVAARASTGSPALTLRSLRLADGMDVPARWLCTRTDTSRLTRTSRLFGARALRASSQHTPLADAMQISSLGGQALVQQTADGDAVITLNDSAGRALWSLNAQGTAQCTQYEAPLNGGRHIATLERPAGGPGRLRERLRHADASASNRQHNLAGTVFEHFDNAGVVRTCAQSLTAKVLEAQRRLLRPEADLPDWAGTSEGELEPPLLTMARHDAVGAILADTSSAGICTLSTYDISGALSNTLLSHGERKAIALKAVQRRADGRVLSSTAGNDVVDTYVYSPTTHRLISHQTARPGKHPLGGLVISDLHYQHDPVGNLLSLEDRAAKRQWHRNLETEGLREFRYDSLYRLASATGRERSTVAGFWSPALDSADRQGGMAWSPYTEHYTYDDSDNLTTFSHNGGAGSRSRHLVVSARSNRALPEGHNLTPDTGFLPGGLQKQLADGRALSWQADNQLRQATLLTRAEADADDTEHYHYADPGTRTRKIATVKTSKGTQITVTTYAAGCETRMRWLDDHLLRHVVICEVDGTRWVEDRLSGELHLRYGFTDHLGSSGGETDSEGKLVCREEYAPFGETTGIDEPKLEADSLAQRTLRHAGKELDATGLYYYGARYSQPTLGRWLSADPAGLVDGPNLYRLVRNNPLRYRDKQGFNPVESDPTALPNPPDQAPTQGPPETAPSSTLDVTDFVLGSLGTTLFFLSGVIPVADSLLHAFNQGENWSDGLRRVGADLLRQLRTVPGAMIIVATLLRLFGLPTSMISTLNGSANVSFYARKMVAGAAILAAGAALFKFWENPRARQSARPPMRSAAPNETGNLPDQTSAGDVGGAGSVPMHVISGSSGRELPTTQPPVTEASTSGTNHARDPALQPPIQISTAYPRNRRRRSDPGPFRQRSRSSSPATITKL